VSRPRPPSCTTPRSCPACRAIHASAPGCPGRAAGGPSGRTQRPGRTACRRAPPSPGPAGYRNGSSSGRGPLVGCSQRMNRSAARRAQAVAEFGAGVGHRRAAQRLGLPRRQVVAPAGADLPAAGQLHDRLGDAVDVDAVVGSTRERHQRTNVTSSRRHTTPAHAIPAAVTAADHRQGHGLTLGRTSSSRGGRPPASGYQPQSLPQGRPGRTHQSLSPAGATVCKGPGPGWRR
jgi:hypothetical protein